jgi:hypothetical protein
MRDDKFAVGSLHQSVGSLQLLFTDGWLLTADG